MRIFELKRQLFHITLGFVIVLLLNFGLLSKFHLAIITVIGGIICFISKHIKIPGLYWLLTQFERPEVLKRFPGRGAFYFLLGSTLSLYLFSKDIALASIMILSLGDSISHYIGKFHGKRKHPFNDMKLIEGSIAGFVVATIGALFFVKFSLAVIGSLFAMSIEAIEIRFNEHLLDDNLLIPLASGIIMTILTAYI
ncbi:hypothetical protein HN419_05640 [Candidatus Woesearchaeota archaeon]|jgi:phytol kinase|nr:hypothetical protein [Candidatus Woesearchaeota archaeon]MBT3537648.1 hypothetical protein [Candidatus Woesearchaeota archaeon]MBT4698418.1 hypothetical protein [Candidatus Woesearchaeota archaeon]MBT4716673.1 hypothetical protein [Candidatus Woesearchaeota archaeon]MBT7105317.1 hypothetical protein [Candidatus Woesearchaeota archaeon]